MTRTTDEVLAAAVVSLRRTVYRQLIWRMVTFLPILWLSLVPCGIRSSVASVLPFRKMVPFTAITASLMSWSKNFSSPRVPNLPKNPADRVNPGTILGRPRVNLALTALCEGEAANFRPTR